MAKAQASTPLRATVIDDYLVIPTKTALPMRCIKTNEAISEEEYQTWDVPNIPRWLIIVMLMSPFFMLFLPFITNNRCRFKAGLSRCVRRKYFLRKIFAFLLFLCPLIAVFVSVMLEQATETSFFITLIFPCFWAAFAFHLLMTRPLEIDKRAGALFYVKGCCPEFLASLQDTAGE